MSKDGERSEDYFCHVNSNAGSRSIVNSGSSSSKRNRVYANRRQAGDGSDRDLNALSLEVVEPQDADYSYLPPLSDELALLNVGSVQVVEPQDADYSYIPPLSDELALLILARIPLSEFAELCLVNKRYLDLFRSGELYKIRREISAREPLIFMLTSGEPHWWGIDPRTGSCHKIPALPSDPCFASGDKESLCAGTHLLVSGKEFEGLVIWRYELAMDRWFKGPSMISPRCLFASANCGNFTCVAGGVVIGLTMQVLNSAEKYNPENKSWVSLPKMNQRRKLCAGCFMDEKFYVIGGVDERNRDLTCGEFYDTEKKKWVLVPDMIKGAPSSSSRSPPLIAVANNELYSLDASSNQMKVYLKGSNSWKELGEVPVRADRSRGWGVAFKSLGDELLVIGGARNSFEGQGMMMFTCCPDPAGEILQWQLLGSNDNYSSTFIFNCSVMVA